MVPFHYSLICYFLFEENIYLTCVLFIISRWQGSYLSTSSLIICIFQHQCQLLESMRFLCGCHSPFRYQKGRFNGLSISKFEANKPPFPSCKVKKPYSSVATFGLIIVTLKQFCRQNRFMFRNLFRLITFCHKFNSLFLNLLCSHE